MKICSVCGRCLDDPVDRCTEIDHGPVSITRSGHREMVPGYSLNRLLASGMDPDTYRARRIDCGRSCLITIVVTDDGSGAAFLHDAEIAATVFDPHIADLYEAGRLASGEYFTVTEDNEEQTLKDRLNAAGIPDLLSSIRIVGQVAEALHFLHLKGLTHGAVRPENILLTYEKGDLPTAKIRNIDVGGAVARNTLSNKFLIDTAIGSLKYFAPEQCFGERTTPRSDVYSLGIVFFEMLAGVPPFDSPKAATLMEMHRNHRPPEIAVDDFHLRMLVTHSLFESLQKQPSFRQASADLFARQMRHIEQLATHVSTPPPAMAMAMPATQPRPVSVTVSEIPSPRRNTSGSPAIDPQSFDRPAKSGSVGILKDENGTPEDDRSLAITAVEDHKILQCDSPGKTARPKEVLTSYESSGFSEIGLTSYEPEVAVPERSVLTEHRMRLKKWKRATDTHIAEPEVILGALRTDKPKGSAPIVSTEVFSMRPIVPLCSAEGTRKPKLIEWVQSDDDLPTLDEVRQVREGEGLMPDDISVFNDLDISPPFSEAVALSPGLGSLNGHVFLFETAQETLTRSDRAKSLLRSIRLVFPILIFGVALIALGVALFGGISSTENLNPVFDTADSVTTAPRSATPSTATTTKATSEEIIPGEKDLPNSFQEKTSKPDETVKNRPNRLSVRNRPIAQDQPVRSTVIDKRELTFPIGSTVVITYKRGNKEASLDGSLAGKRSSLGSDKTAGATRPRIVANPRQ